MIDQKVEVQRGHKDEMGQIRTYVAQFTLKHSIYTKCKWFKTVLLKTSHTGPLFSRELKPRKEL